MKPSRQLVNQTASAAVLVALAGTTCAQISPFPAVIELADLNGANGFAIDGIDEGGRSGIDVSGVGDINGDGVDDLIIGASSAGPEGKATGESYVIFGAPNLGAGGSLDLNLLDGLNGFTIIGADSGDSVGFAVNAAGDVNGDGVDDLLVAAPNADSDDPQTGACYVVFGAKGIGASGTLPLASLDGTNGFVMIGALRRGRAGNEVSRAGDVNGDGFDDVVVAAPFASPNSFFFAGQTTVVFGGANIGAGGVIEIAGLDGTNGFVSDGSFPSDLSGSGVSTAGDLNADGFDDVVIGVGFGADEGSYGKSFVIFGAADVGAGGDFPLRFINGSNGFFSRGLAEGDQLGFSVAGGLDFNDDGVSDVAIGAPGAGDEGACFILFGDSDFSTSREFDLSSLNGANGLRIQGVSAHDNCGASMSAAGDVNGDGVDDLLIGARSASPRGPQSGQSYIVFGGDGVGADGVIDPASLNGFSGVAINGAHEGDRSGFAVSSAGDVNGDGVSDIIIGAYGAKPDGVENTGQSYVIFGRNERAFGDVDGNVRVNARDLADLLGYWGPCPNDPAPCDADLDADGAVGASDIALLIEAWSS